MKLTGRLLKSQSLNRKEKEGGYWIISTLLPKIMLFIATIIRDQARRLSGISLYERALGSAHIPLDQTERVTVRVAEQMLLNEYNLWRREAGLEPNVDQFLYLKRLEDESIEHLPHVFPLDFSGL